MIVQITAFNDYTGNYEDTVNAVAVKTMCLESAERLVKDFLRYDPEQKTYTNELLSGNGGRYLPLPVVNVTALSAIAIDGTVENPSDYMIKKDCVRNKDLNKTFPLGFENVKMTYTAGWTNADMPKVIKLTILRIAALMLTEAGGNIGVTSKSMPDNSRTFVSYTNYHKYLNPLQDLRLPMF